MAGNPACERFIPLLSPYIDGELPPTERVVVERHLSACKQCTGRAADLRAESGLLRVGLDMAVDEVDFKDFTQKVMARVTPEKPPLLERLRLSLSEMFLYRRTVLLSSLATAAVVMLVAVPLLMREEHPFGYASERMRVKAVRSLAAHAQEQKARLLVEVVLVSNKDNIVDPPELEQMKEKFRKQNFNFSSFKRLSQERADVSTQKFTEVRLPNGGNASLKLVALKEGSATVQVVLPRQAAVDVELGRQGVVYQRAGQHVGGELILVLSSPAQ